VPTYGTVKLFWYQNVAKLLHGILQSFLYVFVMQREIRI